MSDAAPSYLITGATGFLGRHVVEAIRQAEPGARIVALVRDSAAAAAKPELVYLEGVQLVEGSLLDWGLWHDDPALNDLRGIYHLAGEVTHSRSNTAAMMRLNVAGTTAMTRLASEKACRLLFVSSSGTVGCSTSPDYSPDETAPFAEMTVRNWPYYLSKVRAEQESRALADETGADVVILRPPVMLGPGDHRYRSIANVMRVVQRRLPFVLVGGMHFCDIRDVANAMIRAMIHSSPRPVYNLPGTASSLEDFFRRVARHAAIEPTWRVLPTRFIWYVAKLNEMAGRPLHVVPDPVVIEMAAHYWGLSSRYSEAELGYRSRDPDQTIADTIDWIMRDASRSGISG